MKTIIILAASLALFGACSAEEDKKTRILNFYDCLCKADQTARDEYAKCAEMKPEKFKKIAQECKEKIMPQSISAEERWDTYCKNEHDEREQLFDCMMNHEEKKKISDEERTEMKEFIQCVKKIGKKHCDSS